MSPQASDPESAITGQRMYVRIDNILCTHDFTPYATAKWTIPSKILTIIPSLVG
jgi:hypothetical protein